MNSYGSFSIIYRDLVLNKKPSKDKEFNGKRIEVQSLGLVTLKHIRMISISCLSSPTYAAARRFLDEGTKERICGLCAAR